MKYEKIRYPDGQISVKILSGDGGDIVAERINSYEDLFFIKSIAEAASASENKLRLYIPCLFGQRSDRRFKEGQSFDLKVIAEVINSCGFAEIGIFDPHSGIPMALMPNAVPIEPIEQVEKAIAAINNPELVLVAPDAGAYKKVYDMAVEFKLPLVGALKHRSLTGDIDLKVVGDVAGKECLIVDDLADGGYTFELLSSALKAQGATKVYLYVSHGYFNKGFDKLKVNIEHIYCTNSVKDIEDPFVTQFKVI